MWFTLLMQHPDIKHFFFLVGPIKFAAHNIYKNKKQKKNVVTNSVAIK